MKLIADLFWSIVHLEFNSEIIYPNRRPTLESVSELWTFLWERIQNLRREKSHQITLPRLRSLDVVINGSSRFNADLSERDDEARVGVVKVRCAELQALRSKMSSEGALWYREQSKIINAVTERALTGLPVELPTTIDPEMMRPPAFRDMLDKCRFHHRMRLPNMI